MKLVAALLIPGVIVVALVYGETRLLDRSSSPSYARAKGVVWAGHTFVNRAQFARWLRAHGVRYRVWARRHPALVAQARPRAAHAPAQRAVNAHGAKRLLEQLPTKTIGVAALCVLLCAVLALRGRRLLRWTGRSAGALRRRAIALGVACRTRRPARPDLTPARRPHPRTQRRRARAPAASRPPILLHVRRRLTETGGGMREAAISVAIVARSAAAIAHRRRGEVAWCLATALLAIVTGLLVSAWLSGA